MLMTRLCIDPFIDQLLINIIDCPLLTISFNVRFEVASIALIETQYFFRYSIFSMAYYGSSSVPSTNLNRYYPEYCCKMLGLE